MAFMLQQFGQGDPGFVILEYIELKTDQFFCTIDSIEDRLEGISPLPQQLDTSGNGEFVLEDSFNGSNGKPVIHPISFSSNLTGSLGAWGEARSVKWTIFVHILRFCSIHFFNNRKTH
jgi:hypothetical protein